MATPGNDTLSTTYNGEYLAGEGGDDQLYTNFDQTTLDGGEANDILTAGGGSNVPKLYGGAGDDVLTTYGANAYLDGGDGNDRLVTTNLTLNNFLFGGEGDDTIAYVGSLARAFYVDGGSGTDLLELPYEQSHYEFSGDPDLGYFVDGGWDVDTWVSGIEKVSFAGGTPVAFSSLVPCYAQGMTILTDRGEVAVEELRPGHKVVTVSGRHGELAEVVWMGHRRVDLRSHPDPEAINPIRIRAGALADGVPWRDLLVSPGHCLWLDGMLVPAKLLLNCTSIVQETHHAEITYWHVELANHDVMLAEGAPAESYFDTGNRHAFENGVVTQLHPDFTRDDGRPDDQRLVPRLTPDDDLAVGAIWEDLADRGARRKGGAAQAAA